MDNVDYFTPYSPQTLQNTIKLPNKYGLPVVFFKRETLFSSKEANLPVNPTPKSLTEKYYRKRTPPIQPDTTGFSPKSQVRNTSPQ
jgi:hypothetical protein